MKNVKELLEEVTEIETKVDTNIKRLQELLLIEAGCKTLNKSYLNFGLEEAYIKTENSMLEKRLLEIRDKEMITINWITK